MYISTEPISPTVPGPVALPAVLLAQMQGWAGARSSQGRNLSTAFLDKGLTKAPCPDTRAPGNWNIRSVHSHSSN